MRFMLIFFYHSFFGYVYLSMICISTELGLFVFCMCESSCSESIHSPC